MGFISTIKDTWGLTKQTFKIIGENPEIFKPTLAQIVIAAFFYILAIISIALIVFSPALNGLGLIMLIICAVFFVLIFPFMKVYYRASQSWIVYNTFTGKNISYKDGLARARMNKGDIFIIGFFDIVLTIIANNLKKGRGILASILGRILEEGWDLVNHFLLPASIIEDDKNVFQVIPKLKGLKNNVTGAFAGVLGFDFVGDLIKKYITIVMILFAALGVFIGVYLGTWIPLAIIIVIIIGFNIIASILIEMVKTVYFTLFYVSVTSPNKISAKYKKDVTNYLMSNRSSK